MSAASCADCGNLASPQITAAGRLREAARISQLSRSRRAAASARDKTSSATSLASGAATPQAPLSISGRRSRQNRAMSRGSGSSLTALPSSASRLQKRILGACPDLWRGRQAVDTAESFAPKEVCRPSVQAMATSLLHPPGPQAAALQVLASRCGATT
jgi:hypothetical protein